MAATDDNLVAGLADRLARLERAELVRRALAAYCTAMDSGDVVALGACFTPDATFVGADGVTRNGRDEIVAFFTGLVGALPPGGLGARHYVTNVDVTPDAPTARCTATFLLVVPRMASMLGLGTYTDEYEISDGVARCTSKHISLDDTVPLPVAEADPVSP